MFHKYLRYQGHSDDLVVKTCRPTYNYKILDVVHVIPLALIFPDRMNKTIRGEDAKNNLWKSSTILQFAV